MTPIASIRVELLQATQAEMADIAQTTQPTVSRWESGELQPTLPQMTRIRAEALKRKLAWNDALFFAGTSNKSSRPASSQKRKNILTMPPASSAGGAR